MLTRRLSLLLLVLLVGFAGPSLAQTTGSLVGRITDESGAPLPGVVVEAKSPALQGVRSAKTDRSGIYRLSLLPPGQYDLTFTLQGFAPLVKNGVPVSLAKDTTLDAALRLKVEEQVKVVGEVPTVDTTSTTLGTTLTSQTIQTLPTGRNYSSVVQVAPGISSDANPENKEQTDITVYGSSGAENSYYIDGVNTTGVEYGFQGKELNYEFIQEVDVKTGGYEAEYGRSTGGIVNVITKSGGNEFHGDVFGYYDNDSLQRNTEKVFSERGTPTGFTKDDFGADLGGYVVKDKLWFFGAYDRVTNTIKSALPSGPQKGEIVDSDSKRDLGAAKLTWRLSESQSLIATFFQDPRKDTGAINDANHTLNGEPLTYQGRQDFGGRDYALRYQGIFGSNWILSGQIARHQEQNSVGPATSSGDIIEFLDKTDPSKGIFQEGGFGLIQEKTFKRDFFGGSLTRFLGGHEIKFGAEYENEKAEVIKRMSGGQQVTIESNPNTASPEPFIYTHFYWTTAGQHERRSRIGPERLSRTQEHDPLPAGPMGHPAQSDAECGAPMGPAGDHRCLRHEADRPEARLRASDRVHLGPDQGPPYEGLRLLRMLLRGDPDGPCHPVLLLRHE